MTHTYYHSNLGTSLRQRSACLSTPVLRTGSSAPGKVSCPIPTVHNSHRLQEACLSKDIGCSPAEAWVAMFKAPASRNSSQKESQKKCPCTTTMKTLWLRFSFALLRVLRASTGAKCKGGNWKLTAEEGRLWKSKEPLPTKLTKPSHWLGFSPTPCLVFHGFPSMLQWTAPPATLLSTVITSSPFTVVCSITSLTTLLGLQLETIWLCNGHYHPRGCVCANSFSSLPQSHGALWQLRLPTLETHRHRCFPLAQPSEGQAIVWISPEAGGKIKGEWLLLVGKVKGRVILPVCVGRAGNWFKEGKRWRETGKIFLFLSLSSVAVWQRQAPKMPRMSAHSSWFSLSDLL